MLSRPAACGIFPDQRSNPRLLHWQADSLPLDHQGSPTVVLTDHTYTHPVSAGGLSYTLPPEEVPPQARVLKTSSESLTPSHGFIPQWTTSAFLCIPGSRGAFPRATGLLWAHQGLEGPQQGKQQSKCFSEVLSSRPRGILNSSGLVYLA